MDGLRPLHFLLRRWVPPEVLVDDPYDHEFPVGRSVVPELDSIHGRHRSALAHFLAYCLHVTLGRRLHALAPGLSSRAVLEKFASISLIDVQLPTTDNRTLWLTRYTQPDQDTQLLLKKLKLELPPQPPPKITAPLAK